MCFLILLKIHIILGFNILHFIIIFKFLKSILEIKNNLKKKKIKVNFNTRSIIWIRFNL